MLGDEDLRVVVWVVGADLRVLVESARLVGALLRPLVAQARLLCWTDASMRALPTLPAWAGVSFPRWKTKHQTCGRSSKFSFTGEKQTRKKVCLFVSTTPGRHDPDDKQVRFFCIQTLCTKTLR